jgi:hypothetical protein
LRAFMKAEVLAGAAVAIGNLSKTGKGASIRRRAGLGVASSPRDLW